MENKKVFLKLCAIILAAVTFLCVICLSVVSVRAEEGLVIDGAEELTAGEQTELSVTFDGEEVSPEDVKWSSTDTHVATVDQNGVVTAGQIRKEVFATIHGKYNGKSQRFDIHIYPAAKKIDILRLDTAVNDEEMLFDSSVLPTEDEAGKVMVLSARVYPEDARQDVEWSSSNPNVATVDEDGTVTLSSIGTTYIVAKATDGSGISSKVKISVQEPIEDLDIELEGKSDTELVIHGEKVDVPVYTTGENMYFYATIKPTDAENASVVWNSSNSSIVQIDNDGMGVVKNPSEPVYITIYGKSKSNLKIYDDYRIIAAPRFDILMGEKRINGSDIQLYDSDGYRKVKLSCEHNYGSKAKVEWNSDDEDIAYVDENGTVFAKAEGKAYVSVKITFDDDSYIQNSFGVKVRGTDGSHYMHTIAMDEIDEYILSQDKDATKGITVTCIGDSITFGTVLLNNVDYHGMVYPKYLEEYIQARRVITMGVGGMPLAREPKGMDKSEWTYYDWNPCVYDILFNDNVNKLEPDNNNPNEEYYKQSNILRLKKSDVIVVIGGVNDSLYSFEDIEDSIRRFGSIEKKEEKTFYGDVDRIMKRLKELAPNAKIIFFTPYHNLRSDKENMLPLERYVDAIKELGHQNDITVVDSYNQDFLNTQDGFIQKRYMPDGIHGNSKGNKLIARHVGAWIVRELNGTE